MHVYQTDPTHTLDMTATTEAERAYWLTREKAAVIAPVEIDVNKFHDAAGLMPPMNWRGDTAQDTESFMLQEMYCGNVTYIYVRCGNRFTTGRDSAPGHYRQGVTNESINDPRGTGYSGAVAAGQRRYGKRTDF